MWNSTGGNFDGGFGGGNDGGFMNTQSQFASPAGQERNKGRRTQNMVPVTIQAIHEQNEDFLVLCGVEVHIVAIVGLIRAVDISSTKRTYTVHDTTGSIEVVHWLESGQEDNIIFGPFMEMTYCRVIGQMRTLQGKHHLLALRIFPITDINSITSHILEVIHCKLYLQQAKTLEDVDSGNMGSASRGMMSSSLVGASGLYGGSSGVSMGGGVSSGGQGLNGQQIMVFKFISESQDEAGAARNEIYSGLKGRLNHSQIDQVVEFLSSEGHIYSTIDDDHFKSTDG